MKTEIEQNLFVKNQNQNQNYSESTQRLVTSLDLSKEDQGRIPGIFLEPEIRGPGWDSWYIP